MKISERWLRLVWGWLGYLPNATQAEAVWAVLNGRRFVLICGGIQAGKSFTIAALALMLMEPTEQELADPANARPRLCWVVGPDYRQARVEFEYIYQALERGGQVKSVSMPNNTTSPWQLETVWGLKVETKSSSDVRKLASYAVDIFIMAEAAQQDYEVFLKAQERVARVVGYILLSGTLEQGLPWYADMLKRWEAPNDDGGFAMSLPTWSNEAAFPGGWDNPEIVRLRKLHEADMDYFWERYGAKPRKATGLVIPEFDYTRHVRHLHPEHDVPVELWIDPGKNAYAVLFVQLLGTTTHVLDRVYKRGVIAQDVIPLCMENPLWDLVRLNKTSHGVIDVAGRHQYGLPSHIEIWRKDAGVHLRSNYVHQDVGRDVVKYRLRDDLLFFNSHFTNAKAQDGTAADVLAEFELWKWRATNPNRSEPNHPIDANNHAIKALGYGLYDHFGPTENRVFVKRHRKRASWKTI